ncbi:hypothetical protein ON010_g13545 [Phytophthora cinnamomi]|nr:hypothetical protein ON010_g13545 [Phytophthora cinnamomi]
MGARVSSMGNARGSTTVSVPHSLRGVTSSSGYDSSLLRTSSAVKVSRIAPAGSTGPSPSLSRVRSLSSTHLRTWVSFWDAFGAFGLLLVAVVLISIAWTTWLTVLTLAPNETANYLMNTGKFDNGQFWLIVDPEYSLKVLGVVALVVVDACYIFILLKLISWRDRHPNRTKGARKDRWARLAWIAVLFVMIAAVFYPILVLVHSYNNFDFDRDLFNVYIEVLPPGSFECSARLFVDPAERELFIASLNSLRILSLTDLLLRVSMNLAFCHRFVTIINLMVETTVMEKSRRSRWETLSHMFRHQRHVPKLSAVLFIVFGAAAIAYTQKSIATAHEACNPHPECVVRLSHTSNVSRMDGACGCFRQGASIIAIGNAAEYPADKSSSVALARRTSTLQPPVYVVDLYGNRSTAGLGEGLETATVPVPPSDPDPIERRLVQQYAILADGAPWRPSSITQHPPASWSTESPELDIGVFRFELAYLVALQTLPDLAPLQNLVEFTIFSICAACCNGFMGSCNLTDPFCTGNSEIGVSASTCLSENERATPATQLVLRRFAPSTCIRSGFDSKGSVDLLTRTQIEMCDGVPFRRCEYPPNSGQFGICMNNRMQALGCVVDDDYAVVTLGSAWPMDSFDLSEQRIVHLEQIPPEIRRQVETGDGVDGLVGSTTSAASAQGRGEQPHECRRPATSSRVAGGGRILQSDLQVASVGGIEFARDTGHVGQYAWGVLVFSLCGIACLGLQLPILEFFAFDGNPIVLEIARSGGQLERLIAMFFSSLPLSNDGGLTMTGRRHEEFATPSHTVNELKRAILEGREEALDEFLVTGSMTGQVDLMGIGGVLMPPPPPVERPLPNRPLTDTIGDQSAIDNALSHDSKMEIWKRIQEDRKAQFSQSNISAFASSAVKRDKSVRWEQHIEQSVPPLQDDVRKPALTTADLAVPESSPQAMPALDASSLSVMKPLETMTFPSSINPMKGSQPQSSPDSDALVKKVKTLTEQVLTMRKYMKVRLEFSTFFIAYKITMRLCSDAGVGQA